MSALINLKHTVFNGLYVIDQAKSKHAHACWRVYCERCHRYSIVSTNVLFNRHHIRCGECFNTMFSYAIGLAIAKKLSDGAKMIELCKEYACSYKPLHTALKLVAKAEVFKEENMIFTVFKKD